MRPFSPFFAILLFGLQLSGSAWADSMDDQIKAAYDAFNAAFDKGDAKAVTSFFTEDAIILGPGPEHAIYKGPAEIEKLYSTLFGMGLSNHTLELIKSVGNGNILVGADKWGAKAKDKQVGGHAMHVFEKQSDGSLKLKLLTFN
jgi:ketosteroid isomerase-like protein